MVASANLFIMRPALKYMTLLILVMNIVLTLFAMQNIHQNSQRMNPYPVMKSYQAFATILTQAPASEDIRKEDVFAEDIVISCRHCKKFFVRRNNRQEYCDNPNCQKARKLQNQRDFRSRKRIENTQKKTRKFHKNHNKMAKPHGLHITAFHTVFFDFIILYFSSITRMRRGVPLFNFAKNHV